MKKILYLTLIALVAVLGSCGKKKSSSGGGGGASTSEAVNQVKPLVDEFIDLSKEYRKNRNDYSKSQEILTKGVEIYDKIVGKAENMSESEQESVDNYTNSKVKDAGEYDFYYFMTCVKAEKEGMRVTEFTYNPETGEIHSTRLYK